jgi:polar amino acid transport system ATP-binding protein
MKKLARGGMTMLVVTHEIGFAYSVANEIIFMEQGKILESGPPAKLVTDPQYERTKQFLSRLSDLYKLGDEE